MTLHSLEEHLDAKGNDILEFLERDVRYIYPPTGESEQKDGMVKTREYYGERCGNTVSICMKAGKSGGKGHEIIRFEVVESTGRSSRIKALYENSDFYITQIFYRIWAKLAIAFGAAFAAQALDQLHKLQHHKP